MMEQILNFDLIDDILNMPLVDYLPIAQSSKIDQIAPLTEFAYFHYPNRIEYLNSWIESKTANKLASAIDVKITASSGNLDKSLEFIRTPLQKEGILFPTWANYLSRAQQAAENAGISKHLAMAIIGTLEEMVDNIIYHSQGTVTGISGFKAKNGQFEYVVADAGVGVLESLRLNPKYKNLNDPLDALKMALQTGVSRHTDVVNRGNGFNRLIRSIANNSCNLRFRSGTACIMFDGVEGQISGKLVQRNLTCPHLNGLIISVLWNANYPPPLFT